jgi:hypothetical protein
MGKENGCGTLVYVVTSNPEDGGSVLFMSMG